METEKLSLLKVNIYLNSLHVRIICLHLTRMEYSKEGLASDTSVPENAAIFLSRYLINLTSVHITLAVKKMLQLSD